MNGRERSGGAVLWMVIIALLVGALWAAHAGVPQDGGGCPAGPYC